MQNTLKPVKLYAHKTNVTGLILTLLTLGGKNSRASWDATGEEAGDTVGGWAGDLLGEEAGMVERVEMLLGDGELANWAASWSHVFG